MILIYNYEQAQKWKEIVESFPDYDVSHLPQYSRAFALHGDGDPHLIYYESDNLRGANVVMRRDIAEDARFTHRIKPRTLFDLTTPYGYGGWIFQGEAEPVELMKLDGEYREYCNAQHIISEFVRFHPLICSDQTCAAMYDIVSHGPIIYLDLCDPETIWENIDRKKKNIIRKAQRSELTIGCEMNASILQQFQDIYFETMRNRRAEEYYLFNKKFYESILDDMRDNALVFYARKHDVIIAAAVVIMAGKWMNYHLTASREEYKMLEPGSLLLYQTAVWGCEHGYQTMILGGGVGSQEDSLYRFKKGFNRNCDCVFKTGRKIFDQECYDSLCRVREESGDILALDCNFFPKYRIPNAG